MGDRTNIAVTQPHLTPKGAECGYVAVAPLAGGGWLCMKCGASGLRADPDTNDDLAAEARQLLDAATPGPWASTGGGFAQPAIVYAPGYEVIEGEGAARIAMCEFLDAPERRADAALIAAAPRLIAALLERAVTEPSHADPVSAEAVARTVAMSHIAAERDAERAARERAETEARQLREAISVESVGVDYCTLHHGIRNEDEHSCDFRDDDQESGDDGEPRECVLVELIQRPSLDAVAEGAEDRGQTDG